MSRNEPGRRRRKRRTIPDYIENKHLYHPETGELLGILSADHIPTDPKKLIAFVRRKAKAAPRPNAMATPIGNPDGWDQLRNQVFWLNLRDHRFWEELHKKFEELPYGVYANSSTIADQRIATATSSIGFQLMRDYFTRLAWQAVEKLREANFQSNSDPVE